MKDVLAAWDWPHEVSVRPIAGGLINDSFAVLGPDGPVAALQALNTRVFDARIHHNLEAVTEHVAAKGVGVPRLVRTRAGDLWHEDADGRVWRVTTWVGERTVHHLDDPTTARSAAALVGTFHAALVDLDWTYVAPRPGPHDTDLHLSRLQQRLDERPEHRLHDVVARLAEHLAATWAGLKAELPQLPLRHIHGDLKISNIRFTDGEAVALIDLDTLARDTLGAELGDAMRSWCRDGPEDEAEAVFRLDLFEAAMRGYAAGSRAAPPTDDEWHALVPSTMRISTELAMRFAWDALGGDYFRHDPARHPHHDDEMLVRAHGQANLAAAIGAVRSRAEDAVRQARLDG